MAVTLGCCFDSKTLTMMAVNRYFRIVKPAKYRRYFIKNKTTIMTLVSWLCAMCSPLPYTLRGHRVVFHPSKFFCYLQIDSGAFTAFLVTVYVLLPTCVIFYCYTRFFKTVRSHRNNFQNTGTGYSTVSVEEIKVARTIFVLVMFFNLFWTPILVIDLVDTIRGRWIFTREVYLSYSFLATISSALIPMIYSVLNRNFQKEYLNVFRCCFCHSPVEMAGVVAPLEMAGDGFAVSMGENNLQLNRLN